jgi:FAD/FMN-containing dehydrogenase
LITVSAEQNPELLPAVRLGLGALGVLISITLQCVPAFTLAASERPEPLAEVLAGFEVRCDGADHFEFYWFPHTDTALTKTNTRLPADVVTAPLPTARRFVDDSLVSNELFRALCAVQTRLPAGTPVINRLAGRLTGNRTFTDRSDRVFTTRRTVRFRELEYALPRAAVPEALRAIEKLINSRGWRISFPIEVRSAAADDIWLSTANGRRTGYIAVHRYWRDRETEHYFDAVEDILLDHDGRPHWGKLHTLTADQIRGRYPHFEDFQAVRDRLDPHRVFANPYLDRVLGP